MQVKTTTLNVVVLFSLNKCQANENTKRIF